MSQLELFTDTERVALRLQREPSTVCAETLHRIRLSVKADRLWRIRIPHAAFAELGVEPEDIAHIPIPTLLLNGEPIVTMARSRFLRPDAGRIHCEYEAGGSFQGLDRRGVTLSRVEYRGNPH